MRKIFILLLAFLCVACTEKYTAGVDAVVVEDTERYVYYATDNDGKPITGMVKCYYDSGKLKYEALFKDGKQDGIEKDYYESGKLEYEAFFKDGIREGVDKKYYKSGKLEYEAPYKDGKLEGIVKSYYESGDLDEVLYKDGEKIGIVKGYYKSGQLNYEADFYYNGEKKQETFYDYGKITRAEEWYSNGEKKRKATYEDGKPEWQISYHTDGRREREHSYKNGILDSTKEYYESGTLFRETSYKDEKKEGIEKWYFENKELWFSLVYKDDKLVSGVCGDGREFTSVDVANVEPKDLCRGQKYNRSEIHIEGKSERVKSLAYSITSWDCIEEGIEYVTVASSGLPLTGIVVGMSYETPFKNGKLDGIKKDYDWDGSTLRIEIPYKDGIKEGIVKEYWTIDQLQYETPYKNGKIDGIAKNYDTTSGKLLWQYTYKNGELDGIAIIYEGDGGRSETPYKDGRINGIEKHYNENGKLWLRLTYKNDEIVSGVCENGKLLTPETVSSLNLEKMDTDTFYFLDLMPCGDGE